MAGQVARAETDTDARETPQRARTCWSTTRARTTRRISDWRNFETWAETAARTAELHAHRLAKDLIETFESPPLDDAIAEELTAFTDRRKAEAGARS